MNVVGELVRNQKSPGRTIKKSVVSLKGWGKEEGLLGEREGQQVIYKQW